MVKPALSWLDSRQPRWRAGRSHECLASEMKHLQLGALSRCGSHDKQGHTVCENSILQTSVTAHTGIRSFAQALAWHHRCLAVSKTKQRERTQRAKGSYLVAPSSGNRQLLLQLLHQGSLLCQLLLHLPLCCSVPLPHLLLRIGRCAGGLRLFLCFAGAAGCCPAVGFLQASHTFRGCRC